MPFPRRPWFAAVLATGLAMGCSNGHDMTAPRLAPPGTPTPYIEDDASRDRVSLAFADLHASLRELDDSARWEAGYYRIAPGSAWPRLREHLDRQATDAGWHHDARISEVGRGYLRRAWTDGTQLVAAALVEPPPGSDGATVLLLLSPARR